MKNTMHLSRILDSVCYEHINLDLGFSLRLFYVPYMPTYLRYN